nr:hypothetical protein Iba_chr08cCG8970 [Ipomoea batatas]
MRKQGSRHSPRTHFPRSRGDESKVPGDGSKINNFTRHNGAGFSQLRNHLYSVRSCCSIVWLVASSEKEAGLGSRTLSGKTPRTLGSHPDEDIGAPPCENVVVDDDVIGLLVTADLGHHIGLNFLFGPKLSFDGEDSSKGPPRQWRSRSQKVDQRGAALQASTENLKRQAKMSFGRRRMATLRESANDAYTGEW